MKFGELRHPVTLQRREEVQRADGTREDVWSNWFLTRAKVMPLRGREFFEAEREAMETTHRIVIRARPTSRPTAYDTRVVLRDGRSLEVQSVIEVEERGEVWELMCKELTR